jgi:hypothetical protein
VPDVPPAPAVALDQEHPELIKLAVHDAVEWRELRW